MTINNNSNIQLPHRALCRAALAGVTAVALAGLAMACSPTTSSTTAATTSSAKAPGSSTAAAQPSTTPSAQPTTSAGTVPSSDQAVLSPATVPPVDKECSYPVTRTADGNATPLFCEDGRLNADAWNFYFASFADSELLTLGRGATATQVYQAMCHDYSDLRMTKPETESTEAIAQAYYGWDVNTSALSARLTNQGCPSS